MAPWGPLSIKHRKLRGPYALDASAIVSLVGFPGEIVAHGNLGIRVNTTGHAVNESVLVAGMPVEVDFTADEGNFAAFAADDLTLSIGDFANISGNFVFEKFDTLNGLGQVISTELKLGATDVTVFVGSEFGQATDETGVKISGATLAMDVFRKPGTTSTYALVSNNGTAVIEGIPDVQLSAGNLTVKIYTTGTNVTDSSNNPLTVEVGGQTLPLNFLATGTGNVRDLKDILQ